MAFPDDPIGGIWGVRPVGHDRKASTREKNEWERGGKTLKGKPGRDLVTLSVEARKRFLEEGSTLEEAGDDASEDGEEPVRKKTADPDQTPLQTSPEVR